MTPVDIFRLFLFVREIEGQQNTGQRVEAIQKWCGGQKGESYCCYLATMVLDLFYQGKSPIPRLGACQDVYNMAREKKNGTRVLADNETPKIGDLFLYVNTQDHAHHIGMVTKDGGGIGIAGNTSPDGTSSNGSGVFEHSISTDRKKVKYVRYT